MNTPIEKARNLGPATGAELRSIGINTLDDLLQIGWEEAWLRQIELYPERLHLMMAYALIGAVHDVSCNHIPPDEKIRAKQLAKELRRP